MTLFSLTLLSPSAWVKQRLICLMGRQFWLSKVALLAESDAQTFPHRLIREYSRISRLPGSVKHVWHVLECSLNDVHQTTREQSHWNFNVLILNNILVRVLVSVQLRVLVTWKDVGLARGCSECREEADPDNRLHLSASLYVWVIKILANTPNLLLNFSANTDSKTRISWFTADISFLYSWKMSLWAGVTDCGLINEALCQDRTAHVGSERMSADCGSTSRRGRQLRGTSLPQHISRVTTGWNDWLSL